MGLYMKDFEILNDFMNRMVTTPRNQLAELIHGACVKHTNECNQAEPSTTYQDKKSKRTLRLKQLLLHYIGKQPNYRADWIML